MIPATIGLGARLAVSGGRESAVRLILTTVGVALGTAFLLLAASADPAIRAQQQRTAWQHTGEDPADLEGSGDALKWWLVHDAVNGRHLTVLRISADGPDAPVPLGLAEVPAAGEVHVSPALADLLDALPPERLADRFPSAPSGLIPLDQLAGPDALVAVVGVADGVLSGPDVLDVHHVRDGAVGLRFPDLLRLVLGIGAVALVLPVVVFVSTSTRIGAARREQRFAALRLAGATPRQTAIVAAVEAGAAALAGTLAGWATFVTLRPLAARIELDGHRPFAADLEVSPWLLALVLVGVPSLAVGAAWVSLRRLQVSPLGAARQAPGRRPTLRRLLPLAAGAAGFAVSLAAAAGTSANTMLLPAMATFALMIYGIVVAGPLVTAFTARLLCRVDRGAGVLLAGRRLEGDPATAFRAVSGLVLAAFVVSVFSGVTPALIADNEQGGDGLGDAATIVVDLPAPTSPATAEDAIAAAARAGGTGGVALRADRASESPDAYPAPGRGPSVLATCEDLAALGVAGTCPRGRTARVGDWRDHPDLEAAPYSVADVAAMPVRALVIETDGTPTTTDRVRTAIERALPAAAPRLVAEVSEEENRRLRQLNRLADVALVVTLTIAGCALAVAVAAGIVERKRPFALLRLAGVPLGDLQRTAFLEAAAPLLVAAGASAVLGLGTAAGIVEIAGGVPWRPPSAGYWLSLAAGFAAALAVAAASLPLLARVTAPDAVRFE